MREREREQRSTGHSEVMASRWYGGLKMQEALVGKQYWRHWSPKHRLQRIFLLSKKSILREKC